MRRTAISLVFVLAGACSATRHAPIGAPFDRADFGKNLWRAATEKIQPSAVSLVPLQSCKDVTSYLSGQALKRVSAYGVAGLAGGWAGDGPAIAVMKGAPDAPAGMPAPAAASTASVAEDSTAGYSTTNVQEAGVDEPDVVKSDGSRILALTYGSLLWIRADGRDARLQGSMALPADTGISGILVAGTRALLFGQTWRQPSSPTADDGGSQAVVMVVDVAAPDAMRTLATIDVDGRYVAARMIDGVARLVVSSSPKAPVFESPKTEGAGDVSAAIRANKRAVRRLGVASWLPGYTMLDRRGPVARKTSGLATPCDRVARTKTFSGFGTTTIMTIDPQHPSPAGSVTVLADAGTVYSSAEHLFVATTDAGVQPGPGIAIDGGGVPMPMLRPNGAVPPAVTAIHAFDISDERQATYLGSGAVRGAILNQWSLSDFEGVLRVATTVPDQHPTFEGQGPASESFVTTFKIANGALVKLGQVGKLGKGQRIYGVRFIGNLGYVVTFRQIDPLYILDLSDPAKPRVRGEVEIPGYSAYLHPLGDHLLLGVGGAADEHGIHTGTQVSLFDVSNPAKPRRLAVETIAGQWTQVEQSHLGFLWWAPARLAIVPMELNMAGFHVGADSIDAAGTITPPADAQSGWSGNERSLVVGETVYTLFGNGLATSTLDGLKRTGWLAFPSTPNPAPVTR